MEESANSPIVRMRSRAIRRVAVLSRRLIERPPANREAIVAQIEFECWRARTCQVCLETD